jgi:hypothetical protein
MITVAVANRTLTPEPVQRHRESWTIWPKLEDCPLPDFYVLRPIGVRSNSQRSVPAPFARGRTYRQVRSSADDIGISREAAVYSACDRRHSLQIHLKPDSKDLRQSLKMC